MRSSPHPRRRTQNLGRDRPNFGQHPARLGLDIAKLGSPRPPRPTRHRPCGASAGEASLSNCKPAPSRSAAAKGANTSHRGRARRRTGARRHRPSRPEARSPNSPSPHPEAWRLDFPRRCTRPHDRSRTGMSPRRWRPLPPSDARPSASQLPPPAPPRAAAKGDLGSVPLGARRTPRRTCLPPGRQRRLRAPAASTGAGGPDVPRTPFFTPPDLHEGHPTPTTESASVNENRRDFSQPTPDIMSCFLPSDCGQSEAAGAQAQATARANAARAKRETRSLEAPLVVPPAASAGKMARRTPFRL